jgi:hypothetical protein
MTPKAKAKELFKKYSKGKDEHGWSLCEFDSCAKQCAMIAVDEILEATKQPRRTYNTTNHGSTEISGYYYSDFWQKVKSEIEKL